MEFSKCGSFCSGTLIASPLQSRFPADIFSFNSYCYENNNAIITLDQRYKYRSWKKESQVN